MLNRNNIIRASFFIPGAKSTRSMWRWNHPMMLVGEPGIGKSDIIEQIAYAAGLKCLVLTASDRDPTEFSGLGFPDKDHRYVTRLVEEWVHDLMEWKRGVCFIDEISTLPPMVQAVLLRVIRTGVVGGQQLPPGIRFIGAMNPPDIAAGGHEIAQPLANRFCWLPFDAPTIQDWCAYELASGGFEKEDGQASAEAEEKRVRDGWAAARAKAAGLITAAVSRLGPHLLFNKPNNDDPKASMAWTSPRTMSMAINTMAASQLHGLSTEEADAFLQACVGEATAAEIITFRNKQDLPDPADVLDGKVDFKHDKKRADKTWAVLGSCVALITPSDCEKRKKRASKMWDLLNEIGKGNADLVATAVRAMMKAGLAAGHSNAFKVLETISDQLDAAGIEWKKLSAA